VDQVDGPRESDLSPELSTDGSVTDDGTAYRAGAILRPNEDISNIAWAEFVDVDGDGLIQCLGVDCCFPWADSACDGFAAIDEPFANRFDVADEVDAVTDLNHIRFGFTDLNVSGNVSVRRLTLRFGRLDMNVPSGFIDQFLSVKYFINGIEEGDAEFSCTEGQPCDTGTVDWEVDFTQLGYSKDEINSLEVEISASPSRLGLGQAFVYQLEAEIQYLKYQVAALP